MERPVYKTEAKVERRHFPRRPLNLNLEFQLIADDESLPEAETSVSENVSLGGLALQTEKNLKVGQEIQLTMFIPPKPERSVNSTFVTVPKERCVPVNIRARVMWRLPFINNKFAYGVNFVEVDPFGFPVYEEFLKEFLTKQAQFIFLENQATVAGLASLKIGPLGLTGKAKSSMMWAILE